MSYPEILMFFGQNSNGLILQVLVNYGKAAQDLIVLMTSAKLLFLFDLECGSFYNLSISLSVTGFRPAP